VRRLVIAIDCDDVLVATTPFFIDAYNKQYGTKVTLADAHGVDETVWAAPQDVVNERIAKTMATKEYAELGPTKEEVDILTELSKYHELHMVTARRPEEEALTQNMLDRDLPGVFTSMEFVGWTGSKGDVCKRIGADILIDDNARHLHGAIQQGLPKNGAILFGAYDWNSASSTHEDLTHCTTWSAVKCCVDEIASSEV